MSIQSAFEAFRKATRGDMRGDELAAFARLAAEINRSNEPRLRSALTKIAEAGAFEEVWQIRDFASDVLNSSPQK